MTTEISINGYFELTVCILNTEIPVDEETAQGVFDDLELGKYVIGIRTRHILDINNLNNPIYSFVLEATDSVEYEFNTNLK